MPPVPIVSVAPPVELAELPPVGPVAVLPPKPAAPPVLEELLHAAMKTVSQALPIAENIFFIAGFLGDFQKAVAVPIQPSGSCSVACTGAKDSSLTVLGCLDVSEDESVSRIRCANADKLA